MLRPATPLTILFFVAFVLLVIATISTPIVKGIHLASWKGRNFGVFGYCTASTCSDIGIGYSVDPKQLNENDSDFSLPPNTRSSLSSILIVHPVAALLTLICFILSAVAHLHAPSHSPRYLLAVLILSIPTLLISLLAFLVDILLFVPHLAWGGWIVLVSTILILASGIVTCAMRRTLVSRKARKKRIAENAEMSGENFYARQAAEPVGPRAETPPPLNDSAFGQSEKLPKFATFESNRSAEDDRVPLNHRTPSEKTLHSAPSSRAPGYSDHGYDRYEGSGRGHRGGMRGGSMRGGPRSQGGPPRDEYGNPLPPSNAFGPMPPTGPAGYRRDRSEPPRVRPQYSDEAMYSGNPRSRGRGGYPPRGYGRGAGYGQGRGGYGRGGQPMGPAGPNMMAGDMRRGPPPPPGYNNGYPPMDRAGQYEAPGGPAGYGRSPSAPTYGARRPSPPSAPRDYDQGPSPEPYPGPHSAPRGYNNNVPSGPSPAPDGYGYGGRDQEPNQYAQTFTDPNPRPQIRTNFSQGPPVIGQAVEMDAVNGCPSPTPMSPEKEQIRDSDTDVQGFVGLQQQQKHRDSPMSLTSVYSSQEAYVPPRSNWTANANGRTGTPPLSNLAIEQTADDPVELPVQTTLRKGRSGSNPNAPSHHRKASDNYYEDVDPRFANDATNHQDPTTTTNPPSLQPQSATAVPPSLVPGLSTHRANHPTIRSNNAHLEVSDAYEAIPDGQRSPASDHSDMTSISQRGVNPNWRPGSIEGPGRYESSRRPVQDQRGVVLGPNPEFETPVRGDAGSRLAHLGPTQMGQAF